MSSGAAALRKFVRPRDAAEHCDACGAALIAAHAHQFDPLRRRVRCACGLCAKVDSGWREIPTGVRALPDFRITDAQWNDLAIPISLAFFSWSTPAERIIAFYPGPAGAAESTISSDAWREIEKANPELLLMKPDVEALVVNRVGAARDYILIPIDECYKLVGLIRIHWRGLSGGAAVWGEIGQFFDKLRRRESACLV